MAALTSYMWEQNKKLQVYFMEGSEELINKTLEFANIWNEHCNVSFVRTKNRDKSHLRVAYKNTGCWSYIGNVALQINKSEPTINLEISNLPSNEPEFKRIVLHEFGHALGLIHEHQSPPAEMKWKKSYVYRYFYFRYGWNKQLVDTNLFDEYENYNKLYSTLDKKSVMAYYLPKEFTENEMEFPLNYNLSKMDIDYIGKLYPKMLLS